MPHYLYGINISKQKRFISRFKKLILIVMVVILMVGAFVIADTLKQNNNVEMPTGAPVISSVKIETKDFTTPYYSFTTTKNWKNIEVESNENKYVYRSYRGTNIEQELKIFVNEKPNDLSATRVLPIILGTTKRIVPSEISEHCNTQSSIKKANGPIEVTILGTKMLCQLDGSNFIVVVAIKGGGTDIVYKKPDGAVVTFNIIYRSSSVPADSAPLTAILRSFIFN